MKLCNDHIDLDKCPQCGCPEIGSFTKSERHCNGHWNERIAFKCGAKFHFSPNFLKTSQVEFCRKFEERVQLEFIIVFHCMKCKNQLTQKIIKDEFLHCKCKAKYSVTLPYFVSDPAIITLMP